jgi:hypothetical protein
MEVPYFRRQRCADTCTRAELLVRGLKPCRRIDGVAIGRVIEKAADVTDLATRFRSRFAPKATGVLRCREMT